MSDRQQDRSQQLETGPNWIAALLFAIVAGGYLMLKRRVKEVFGRV